MLQQPSIQQCAPPIPLFRYHRKVYWETLAPEDLEECLAIAPLHIGDEHLGRTRALECWRWLIRQRSFIGVSIRQSADPIIYCCGFSVFVQRSFAQAERLNPAPGLNGRILRSIAEGSPVALTLDQVAADNAAGCLHEIILYANWRRDLCTARTLAEVQTQLPLSYLQTHNGYRMQHLMVEATDAIDCAFFEAVVTWRLVTRYEPYFAQHPQSPYSRDRLLGEVTLESVLAESGSVAMPLFVPATPILGLSDGLQQLALAALEGLSDVEIARRLHVSLAAVRWRWAQLFNRVSEQRPDVVTPQFARTRGPEKRSRLLRFLREHPEELRPYRRGAPQSARP